MNRNKWIAAFTGLALIAYFIFSGPIMNFFNPSGSTAQTSSERPPFVVEDITVGTGETAVAGRRLSVHYVGTLTDGRVFDSSRDSGVPFSFVLGAGGVIRGWDEGLVGMREGGRRLLIISPEYGYGNRGVGSIPPDSTLIFEVELLDVE